MLTSCALTLRPAWLGAALAAAIPLGAWAEPAPVRSAPAEAATYEAIVRATYARLHDYIRAADHDIRFEVADLRTYLPAEFAGVRWLDAVDMPGGAMVDVTRAIRQHDNSGRAGVRYEASWSEGDDHGVTPEREAEHAKASLASALQAAAAGNADLRDVRAVTSFAVTVTLDGRSRAYRAAFAWLPHSLTAYRFVVADNIVQGVEEAAREALPAWSREDELADLGIVPVPDPAPQSCQASTSTTTESRSYTGTDGHLWGEHKATADFSITCTCTSSCASTCSANVSGTCSDSGFAEMCHKMASAFRSNAVTNDNGAAAGAACAAGYGCVKKSCLFCLCGLSVSVSVLGASVTFTSSGADWEGNMDYSRTCGKCVPVEQPPPPPPPGGGGGGGGGGGTPPPAPCGGMGTPYDFDCGNNGSWEFLEYCVYSGQSPADVGCSLCYGSPLHQPGSTGVADAGLVAQCIGFNLRGSGGSGTSLGGSINSRLSAVAVLN